MKVSEPKNAGSGTYVKLPPPLSVSTPFAIVDPSNEPSDRVSPSGSESFARTSNVTPARSSSFTDTVSSTAVGGSGCAVTWIVKVCATLVSEPPFAVPPSSTACTLTTAEPEAFGAVVKVSDPSAATAG